MCLGRKPTRACIIASASLYWRFQSNKNDLETTQVRKVSDKQWILVARPASLVKRKKAGAADRLSEIQLLIRAVRVDSVMIKLYVLLVTILIYEFEVIYTIKALLPVSLSITYIRYYGLTI